MKRSEIFDSFVKIAQEKGMISSDAPEKAVKKLENAQPYPRWDSKSVKDIEKLYHVKPDCPKDMEYDRNIIQDAHPNPAVISPAHDKINGLFTNNNEQNNIIVHIVSKNPNGQYFQQKLAEKNLTLNLVRLGNYLDNANSPLRSLADSSLIQLNKQAGAPLAAAVMVAGYAALIGLIYWQQHSDFTNEGFKINHQKLIAEIDDFITSNADFGVGYKYRQEFIAELEDFKSKLEELNSTMEATTSVIDSIEKPKTAEELQELAQKSQSQDALNALKTLKAKIHSLTPIFVKYIKNFASHEYRQRQIEEKGFISKLIDAPGFLHGEKGLIADDFDDVIRALVPYRKSLQEVIKVLKESSNKENAAKIELEAASSEENKEETL